MKNNHLQSISAYLSKSLVFWFLCLAVISYCLLIVFGIHQAFESKKKEAQRHANLISNTVSMSYELGVDVYSGHIGKISNSKNSELDSNQIIKLYSNQLTDIVSHDSTISNINYIEINNNASQETTDASFDSDGDRPRNSLLVALTEDSYSVQENIVYEISTNTLVVEQILPLAEHVDKNLVGYVFVSIDLQTLRKQWFEKNIWLLVMLTGAYLLIGVIVLNMIMSLKKQSIDLLNNTKLILDDNELSSIPILRNDTKFIEIYQIKQALIKLINNSHEVNASYKKLQMSAESSQQKDKRLTNQLNQFQYLISHELKSSINSIVGGAQLLSQQYLSEEQNDALAIIRKGSHQLSFILEQVAQLNKIEKGKVNINRVEFNPLELVSDIVAEYQVITDQKHLELISAVSHMDYELSGDIDKIRKILQIIMDNAVKYTNKGSVTIESSLQHFDRSTRWTIRVTDTGVGINSKYHEDVFAPFFQGVNSINNEQSGVGIGLTLARQLADALDASLTLDSAADDLSDNVMEATFETSEPSNKAISKHGTTVELVIPLLEKSQTFDSKLLKNKNIAYFQSEHNIHDEISQLVDFGAKDVSVYLNIDELIKGLNDKHIDVLILSNNIPGDTVSSVTKRYRQEEKNHRSLIVWLHADETQEIRNDYIESMGIDFVVQFPYEIREVATSIHEWL